MVFNASFQCQLISFLKERFNVFSGTLIPDDEVKKKRLPIPAADLLKIQQECMELDDESRWLIALICDTGMRL